MVERYESEDHGDGGGEQGRAHCVPVFSEAGGRGGGASPKIPVGLHLKKRSCIAKTMANNEDNGDSAILRCACKTCILFWIAIAT